MQLRINRAVTGVLLKDLRTNRVFLILAALSHLLYLALIFQTFSPRHYLAAIEPLRKLQLIWLAQSPALGTQISIILAFALIVLIQSDGLSEPYHDLRVRPITPVQILAAKFLGLGLVVFAPRFLIDVASSVFLFRLTPWEGCAAALLHLLSDAALDLFVVAIAVMTSTLAQTLLVILLLMISLLVGGLTPTYLSAIEVPHYAGAGADLSWFGGLAAIAAMAAVALSIIILSCVPSTRRMVRKVAVIGLLIFPCFALLDFFIPWSPGTWSRGSSDGYQTKMSADSISAQDALRIESHMFSDTPYQAIRVSSTDDWLAIATGTIDVNGLEGPLSVTYGDAGWVERVNDPAPSFRRILFLAPSQDDRGVDPKDMGRVLRLPLKLTGLTRLGALPITRDYHYRPVPGGGSCRIGRHGRDGFATCVGALSAPCVTFGYPYSDCTEKAGDWAQLFRWPLPWTTSSSSASLFDSSDPRDTQYTFYRRSAEAIFWKEKRRFIVYYTVFPRIMSSVIVKRIKHIGP